MRCMHVMLVRHCYSEGSRIISATETAVDNGNTANAVVAFATLL